MKTQIKIKEKELICINCEKNPVKREIKESNNYFSRRKRVCLCPVCFMKRIANFKNLQEAGQLIKGVDYDF